ncbi:hypothetical protein [Malacoplasma penetrans HF-2]|uniref:Uncharacterized protein n=2 Tax=Malacoplasma penetrans TaxID=28227 RepID=Q8EVE2_MALP2|nr:hypothetical protein [Malacoplasma penetrans]BAC44412.1 hypothetical protein [Malacoplasma penetrans HF-2]
MKKISWLKKLFNWKKKKNKNIDENTFLKNKNNKNQLLQDKTIENNNIQKNTEI